MKTTLALMALAVVGLATTALDGPAQQAQAGRVRFVITGTPGPDVITVNDAAGVICGSAGVSVEGSGLRATLLRDADAACPGSEAGHQQWAGFDGKADNYFTGNFREGDDRYTRIDGPGNDRYEYMAGDGNDVITSSDGPGNDEYLYNNGAGNDFSVHVNNSPLAGGNDLYRIDGGPGIDLLEVLGDGPGDDVYEFHNGESVCYKDFALGDKDTFRKLP